MNVTEWIADVLQKVAGRGETSQNPGTRHAEEEAGAGRDEERENEPTTSRRDTGREAAERPSAESESNAQLYRCSPCGTTYVSSEMDACPNCDGSLDRVPSGRELGIA